MDLRGNPLAVTQIDQELTIRPEPPTIDLTPDELQRRATFVKEMVKKAFACYVKFSTQSTRRDHAKSWFGKDHDRNMISSMTTLHVMGLKEEYEKATKWLIEKFDVVAIGDEVVVSQLISDYMGGLLSCYALVGDKNCLDKARRIAEYLEPVYERNEKEGKLNNLPYWKCSLREGTVSGLYVPLSNLAYGVLEYTYLSDVTGDLEFKDRIDRVRTQLADIKRPNDLIVETFAINQSPPESWSTKVHLFSQTRDYYTDLVKGHIQSGAAKSELLDTYKKEIDLVVKRGTFSSSKTGLVYSTIFDASCMKLEDFMDHEGLYLGAMFALGAKAIAESTSEDTLDSYEEDMQRVCFHFHLATALTITGREVYKRSDISLAPRRFYFNDLFDGRNGTHGSFFKQYLLMPELAESYFVLWRMTGQNKWREAAWTLAQMIQEKCYSEAGFSGIDRIDQVPMKRYSYQPVHLISSTLKYIYLTFAEDSVLPLGKWVFNSCGHPLPIKGAHPRYPENTPSPVFVP